MKNEVKEILKELEAAQERIGEFYDDDFGDAVYTIEGVENRIANAIKGLKEMKNAL